MTSNLPPMRGKFDFSKTPCAMVTNIQGTLYVLTLIKYGDSKDGENYEYVFTPYTDGKMVNDGNNYIKGLAQSLQQPNNTKDILTPIQVELPDSDKKPRLAIQFVEPVAVTWNGNSFIFNSLNIGIISMRLFTTPDSKEPNVKYTSMIASNQGSAINFTIGPLQTDNNYFDQDPNFFAGFPYILDYQDSDTTGFPFRIFKPFSTTTTDGTWLQPSTCTKGASGNLTPAYLCNLDTHGTNPNNVSYYLSGIPNLDDDKNWYSIITIESPQTPLIDTPIFFIPTNYYQANFQNSGSSLESPSQSCILSTGLEGLLNNFYYFWSSGFTQYSNDNDLTKFNTMITTPGAGFLSQGPTAPLNIASWTTLEDCQRSYFYNYCDTGKKCGPCFGSCLVSAIPCQGNDNFTPTNLKNVNPFTCTSNVDPRGFWNRWKDWIIGSIIGIVAIILIIVILISVIANKKSKPSSNKEPNLENETVVYR